ncbi:MAG TPA: winged helix DNA-binding domain-containing protein [Candidatus Bathyarchaeia archaeon]|nr:winged helix DNA-binding domain-containing protein [Candidatus Bathyarchaeia archaeon]
MAAKITWKQALAWRMRRQLLDPVADESAVGVVRRLCAVQAQVSSFAELCVRVRRTRSKPGDVGRALSDGRLIKTWAMRGTLHLLTPEDAGAFLSLIASGRPWDRPSWQQYFGVTPKQLDALREVIRDALQGKVLTREELIAAVIVRRGYGHLGDALRSGWGTLLKPYAWQGDLCFGPNRGNRVTFVRPEDASPRWARLPEPDEAAAIAIVAYLRAYGPATAENFHNWLSRGRVSTRQVRTWFGAVADRLRDVEVGGERRYVLAEDLDELQSTKPTKAVRLLPGFDQYVLGPGTDDPHVLSPARRRVVSQQSGWIAPIVVSGGVVTGTWKIVGENLQVAWFSEAGAVPRSALRAEVERLSTIVERELSLVIS